MALIDCKFFSESLGMSCSMRALLPEPSSKRAARRHPVLWLLHGLTDDETAWTRFSALERHVGTRDLAVIMPNVHRSYYSNMKHGYRYWDFVSEELLYKARALFPLSSERAQNFVAGLSMGGYGALKLALSQPHRFAAAASLSGACQLAALQNRPEELRSIFGDAAGIRTSGGDLQELARTLAASNRPKPKLYQACGTEDERLEENRRFRDFILPLGFDFHYEEAAGAHDWAYWDTGIQQVLAWLPLP